MAAQEQLVKLSKLDVYPWRLLSHCLIRFLLYGHLDLTFSAVKLKQYGWKFEIALDKQNFLQGPGRDLSGGNLE